LNELQAHSLGEQPLFSFTHRLCGGDEMLAGEISHLTCPYVCSSGDAVFSAIRVHLITRNIKCAIAFVISFPYEKMERNMPMVTAWEVLQFSIHVMVAAAVLIIVGGALFFLLSDTHHVKGIIIGL
jgi:hypothetical protein